MSCPSSIQIYFSIIRYDNATSAVVLWLRYTSVRNKKQNKKQNRQCLGLPVRDSRAQSSAQHGESEQCVRKRLLTRKHGKNEDEDEDDAGIVGENLDLACGRRW